MKRSAIIIGVDRTGGMPELKDAAKGARRFEAWARAQQFDPIHVFTDEGNGVVEVKPIKTAIRKIVEDGVTEQLVIYFAGHGVNIGYGEYWLLSDAPADAQAAVNVRSSAWMAAYSGIPHTVFISDACRTAAEGAQAQRVTGSEIFPNDGAGDLEKPVDTFYACTLGRPALEVRDPAESTREFTALYTDALLDGLAGKHPDLLDWTSENGVSVAYVRPRPLKPHLTSEVPRRITQLGLQRVAVQIPDAHVVSESNAWVARLTAADGVVPLAQPPTRGMGAQPALLATAETASAELFHAVLNEGTTRLASPTRGAVLAPGLASELVAMARKTAEPFGPFHQETQCGFKLRGARFIEAYATAAGVELFDHPGDLVRVGNVAAPGASVLLVLENGTGTLLPAIPGFLAALTVEEGELVDVAYEPSDNTWRWDEYQHRADELRALRAVAASATRSGVFRLDGADALEVARRMQFLKGVDPTLAIYAAYAYHDLQRRDLIKSMGEYMHGDLGACMFDIALLARELHGQTGLPHLGKGLFSCFPLLSQGWSLLAAQQVQLPAGLEDIQGSLVPSVWTLFDAAGVAKIKSAIEKGHIQ